MQYSEPYPHLFTKALYISMVCLVWYIVHHHMHSLHLYAWLENPLLFTHQAEEHQRILTTRESHEHPVAILQQRILGTSPVKKSLNFFSILFAAKLQFFFGYVTKKT